MYVILDIDGTLANNDHRSHLVECERPDWEAFLKPELVAKDTIIEGVVRGLQHFAAHGYDLIFLTGRNEGLRPTTETWLSDKLKINVKNGRLLMRPLGNMLKPTEYKLGQLQQLLSKLDRSRGFLAIDDDKYMWPVYANFATVLRAPDCWTHLFPETGELEAETHWRR